MGGGGEILVIPPLFSGKENQSYAMWILNVFQVHKSVRIYIAHFSVFNCHLHPSIDRSLASWYYPKTVNQPSARTMTGLRRDPSGKMRLYVFGFTRNNA